MKGILLAIDWSLIRVGLIFLGIGVFKIVLETVVMLLFKFDRFRKVFVDSVMANIGLILLVILLVLIFNKTEFAISQFAELVILYCITSIFEAWLIRLLNVTMAWARIIIASFAMNLLSFLSLYFIFTTFLARFFSLDS